MSFFLPTNTLTSLAYKEIVRNVYTNLKSSPIKILKRMKVRFKFCVFKSVSYIGLGYIDLIFFRAYMKQCCETSTSQLIYMK